MTDEREKIIARIQALQAKTTEAGCTEAEALTAAKMVKDLLEKYQMELSDVELVESEGNCVEGDIDTGSKVRLPIERAVGGIADFTNTKVWFNLIPASIGKTGRVAYRRHIVYFGLPSDVQLAKSITTIIQESLAYETERFHCSEVYLDHWNRRAATRGFQIGFVRRVVDQLVSMKVAAEPVVTSSGTELMVLKDKIVNQAFKDLNLNMKHERGFNNADIDRESYMAGYIAGQRVNLQETIGE